MGLKLLHSADWHLGSPFRSLPEENREALKRIQLDIPNRMAEICRREGCDLVLLSGDVFDSPTPDGRSVEALRRALAECGAAVCIAPGNHDYCSADSPWITQDWPENVHIFKGDMEFLDFPELDCRVYGAGYRSMDCPALLEGFRASGGRRWNLGVVHGDPVNANSPYCPVNIAQVKQSELDYLALGHIHAHGAFRAGRTLCAWPGCPMGRGWDETGEKGMYLVDLQDCAETRWLPLDYPQFFDLTVEIGGDAQSALEAALPPVRSRNLYRVTLTGEGEAEPETLKRRFAHLPLLLLRDETRRPEDLWALAGEDSLRGLYFELLKNRAQEPEQAEIAQLAAKLSGKLLRGEEVALP